MTTAPDHGLDRVAGYGFLVAARVKVGGGALRSRGEPREDAMRLCLCRRLAIAAFVSYFLGSVQTLAQNAYITNDGSGNVSVIDTATNTVIATITVGTAPFAVAVSPDGGTVYVANIDSDNVSVIDTATNKVIATITVGNSPRAWRSARTAARSMSRTSTPTMCR
jgi:YVTN family beta-propeller protein